MIKINKNVVIAALARDCAGPLSNNISLIEQLRDNFLWSHVVVVENDSKDNTKEILFNWERESKDVKIISKNFGVKTIPDQTAEMLSPSTSFYRIEKMAFYRNIYIDYIKSLNHKIDYVIIIDVDVETFSIDGIIKSIEEVNDNWGGIFSNGITKSNILGFSSEIYFDIFAVYEYPLRNFFSYTQKDLEKSFKTVNKQINKHNYYSVISAFSGIGIYKYEAIKNLRYEALRNIENSNEAICEHIPFNAQIIKLGYKNYISKDLFVLYGSHNFGLILKLYLPSVFLNFTYITYHKIINFFNIGK